jgi:hypothetical protein
MKTGRPANVGIIRLKYVFVACALLLVTVSKPIQAAQYQYDYYSNFFSGTGTYTVTDPDGSPQTLPSLFDGFIDASIYSPVLLGGGSGLPAGATVNIAFYTLGPGRSPELQQTLSYPSTGQPDDSLVFSIGAVDGSGLPLEWNIAINSLPLSPSPAQFSGSIFISTHLDGIMATFEGNSYDGSIANSPGLWQVTVVPEADGRLMLLTGLGLIGLMLHKRTSGRS